MTVADILDRCRTGGLGLSAIASVGAYNSEVDMPYRLPGADDRLVIVLGNNRELWPHIARFVSDNRQVRDPVDEYVTRTVTTALSDVADVIDVRYSHDAPPRRIAIQRLAHVAGLAWLSPSHLCVHPEFGPWIALRAAVVLDRPAPPPGPEATSPCDCESQCLPKLQEAVSAGEPEDNADMVARWEMWLAMRDACPVGRRYRYSDEQIRYHYLGERPAGWPAAT